MARTGENRYAHPCSDRRRCLRVRRRRAHNTAERSRETRHHAGAVPATGMAIRRGSVRTARRREGVLRQVRRRTLPHRDSRQLERRARALRPRLRSQPGTERIQPARRQPHHPRTSRQRRVRLGRVELPVQRLRARARSRRHDGARRAVHEIERRPRTAAHVSDRHVDGRTRHDSRSARISNRVCRRSRDVSRRTGVVRLLRRRRRRRRSDYRCRVQVRFDPAGHREDRRAIGRAARLHGKGTPTRQRRNPDQRRTAAVRPRRTRVWRTLHREHQRIGARRHRHAAESRRHDHAHQVRDRRRPRAYERPSEPACPTQDGRSRVPRRQDAVRRSRAIRRQDRAAAADHARHR